MKSRLLLSICLLFALLLCGIGISAEMNAANAGLSEAMSEASAMALEGKTEEAVALAAQAKARWEKCRRLIAAVADHTPMDEVDNLFQEMEIYGKTGEIPHFSACCIQLSSTLRAMYEAHTLHWWNLL